MKKTIILLSLALALIVACGNGQKVENFESVTLYAGPDTTEPAITNPTYLVEIFVNSNAEKERVAEFAIEIMKQQLAENPDMKRAKLNVHADSVNFTIRRPEIKIGYYGTGEPQVEINRWEIPKTK